MIIDETSCLVESTITRMRAFGIEEVCLLQVHSTDVAFAIASINPFMTNLIEHYMDRYTRKVLIIKTDNYGLKQSYALVYILNGWTVDAKVLRKAANNAELNINQRVEYNIKTSWNTRADLSGLLTVCKESNIVELSSRQQIIEAIDSLNSREYKIVTDMKTIGNKICIKVVADCDLILKAVKLKSKRAFSKQLKQKICSKALVIEIEATKYTDSSSSLGTRSIMSENDWFFTADEMAAKEINNKKLRLYNIQTELKNKELFYEIKLTEREQKEVADAILEYLL